MNQLDYEPLHHTPFTPTLPSASGSQPQSFFSHDSVGSQALSQQSAATGGFNISGVNVANGISHQQLAGQQLPFNNTAFSQPSHGPTVTASSGQIGSFLSGTLATNIGLGQGSPQAQGISQHSLMAAPPNPIQVIPQTPGGPQYQSHSPNSPADDGREKERLELMLTINTELLQEMQSLQTQGKGGAPTTQHAQMLKEQGLNPQMASDEFIQVMLRLHANLGYLCGISDYALKPGSRRPHPPNYVQAPFGMPQLSEKYSRLRALFPGWTGHDGRSGSQSSGVNMGGSPA